MTAAAQDVFPRNVAGDGAFSTWMGATIAGRGALWQATPDLGEIRDIPHGERLPNTSVVYFCRCVTLDGRSARFLGVMRIAPDSKNRRGVHGYGILLEGRDVDRFPDALEALAAWDEVDEDVFAKLTSSRAFADASVAPDRQPDLSLFSAGRAVSFALPRDVDRNEAWKTLWCLSYTMPDIRDLFAARALADEGVDVLPPCPAMPPEASRRPGRMSGTRHGSGDTGAISAPARDLPRAAPTDPLAEIAAPLPAGDIDALRQRVDDLGQIVHDLVHHLDEQDRRIQGLEGKSGTARTAAPRRAATGQKAAAHGHGGEFGGTKFSPHEPGDRIPWFEITILAVIVFLLAAVGAWFLLT